MSKLNICVEDDIFVSDNSDLVNTIFYLEYEGRCFPDGQWTDFSDSVLGMWAHAMLKNKDLSNVQFELHFMDGPYKLDVFKDSEMQLQIDCICFRYEMHVESTLHCSYIDFLITLYEAYKSFKDVLFHNGMNKGRFQAIYNQAVISINELKTAVQSYN